MKLDIPKELESDCDIDAGSPFFFTVSGIYINQDNKAISYSDIEKKLKILYSKGLPNFLE